MFLLLKWIKDLTSIFFLKLILTLIVNARDMYLKPPYSNDIDLRWDLPRDPPPSSQPHTLHPPPPPRNLRWLASPGCTGKVNKLDI